MMYYCLYLEIRVPVISNPVLDQPDLNLDPPVESENESEPIQEAVLSPFPSPGTTKVANEGQRRSSRLKTIPGHLKDYVLKLIVGKHELKG